ncbi:Amidohydrolase 2 [Cynara cardunculus var. scolymus]|uniref:Amidohydrolase 2 n=1 Tax=Cynara cardunculus var. scolymus TaxID=59895 RepID=A0A103YAV2_CYNCS|nr:Amidohydrolase 2 [Cynara cardunculus var. scolymus]
MNMNSTWLNPSVSTTNPFFFSSPPVPIRASQMAATTTTTNKIIDSHLHVWASPQQMIIMFVDSVLKKHPSKFVGCCLANPAQDATGLHQLEHLILEDGYRAVRFNPYLWPSGQLMTNEIGKAMFWKAGELGVPVGIMCMKGLNLHISEIEKLCTEFPKTTLVLDHLGFCKPPTSALFLLPSPLLFLLEHHLISLAVLVYVKFSGLFRVSRNPFPYQDLCPLLSQLVSSFGANRLMWGSDFPFVVQECGYKQAKEAVYVIANQLPLSSSDLEWIMGKTAMQLFQGQS